MISVCLEVLKADVSEKYYQDKTFIKIVWLEENLLQLWAIYPKQVSSSENLKSRLSRNIMKPISMVPAWKESIIIKIQTQR